MADLRNIMGGVFNLSDGSQIVDNPDKQLIDAIIGAGMSPPDQIIFDGLIHRFRANGKKRGDKSAWYVAFGGRIHAGCFGDWATGLSTQWSADIGRALSDIEIAAWRGDVERAQAVRDAQAAQNAIDGMARAQSIIDRCTAAPADNPYLIKKGIQPHSALFDRSSGRLVVPIYNGKGELISLQYIADSGEKRFLSGATVVGGLWFIGSSPSSADERIYAAEGFATAASIHEATGSLCYIAYSASGLLSLAETIHDHGFNNLTIVADNDASETGIKYAQQAADRIDCEVIIMPERGDANDYAAANGLSALADLLLPDSEKWLVGIDEFCKQPAPVNFLIRNWIQGEALIMIHGPSGVGKTFFAIDTMLHIASDKPDWRGQPIKTGPVVYLAGEGHAGLKRRFAAWMQHHQASNLTAWISKSGCNLDTPAGLEHAIKSIHTIDVNPVLIVVDTLHMFMSGDENTAVDAKPMIDNCNALQREFGTSVALIHHTGHNNPDRGRGSSAWRGSVDVEIGITPNDGVDTINIVMHKARDFDKPEPVYSTIASVDIDGWIDDDGEQVSGAVAIADDEPVTDDPPPKLSKEQSKIASFSRIIERAWWAGGEQMADGKLYVSKESIKDIFLTDGKAPATANQNVKPAAEGRCLNVLLNAEIVAEHGTAGLLIIDGAIASSLALRSTKASL